jgi:ABC-type oligopeptide transport system substrate-binding subunit
MNKIKPLLIIAAFLAVGSLAFFGCKSGRHQSSGGQTHQYTCAMHSEVTQAKAGACPKCGMKLEEKH